jgi:hypothetical protein
MKPALYDALGFMISSNTVSRHKINFSTLSRYTPLVEKHHNFLLLVKNHGNADGDIVLNVENQIANIRILNPEKRNSITGRMMYQLAEIVDKLSNHEKYYDKLVAIALVGDKSAFCSGFLVKYLEYTVHFLMYVFGPNRQEQIFL